MDVDDEMLAALRALAMPVAVIGASAGGERGCSTGTVAYLSLRPVLLVTSLGIGSRTLRLIAASGRLSISLLSADQADVAVRAGRSSSAADKFAALGLSATVPWNADVPAVAGALVALCCSVQQSVVAGDHHCLIASVDDLVRAEGKPLPLLRFQHDYVTVGALGSAAPDDSPYPL